MFMKTRLMSFGILFVVLAAATVSRAQEVVPGPGVLVPVVLREVKPDYTPEAKKAGVQGNVEMSAVVKEDGTVGDVRITRSLDEKYGLDDQAVIAMKKWQFKPGSKDGKPVAVRVNVEMTFRLR